MTDYRNSITILLVEDNVADQKLTERAFKKSKKTIDLKIVNSGNEAINYLHQIPPFDNKQMAPQPDIILMDINMPGLDGKQTLRRIRNSQNIRYIPIIMLTTSSEEQDILDSYKLGANAYITKPHSIDEFQTLISKLEDFWLNYNQFPPKF